MPCIVVIGVIITSGCIPYPRRRMYWSTQEILRNSAIASVIGKNRFEQIFSKLHFVDNNTIDSADKFAKVKPLIETLNENFLSYGPITNAVSVDEAIVPYYGFHGAKQFIKGKPVRFGFKVINIF